VQPSDDPGGGAAGAGVSPTDPGAPGDGDDDGAADAADDDVVSAVEDLVRDLLPDGDASRG